MENRLYGEEVVMYRRLRLIASIRANTGFYSGGSEEYLVKKIKVSREKFSTLILFFWVGGAAK